MARIAGVNIPQNKLVHVGLTYIYGIGNKFSQQICQIFFKFRGFFCEISYLKKSCLLSIETDL